MMDDQGREHLVRLLVRRRRIEHGQEGRVDALTVHCPIARQVQTVEHCSGCARFESLNLDAAGASLVCSVPDEPIADPRPSGSRIRQFLDGSFAAEVAWPELECLDPELQTEDAEKLMEANQVASAPVVDDRGVLVGVLTAQTQAHPRDAVEVEDAMSTELVTLPQGASVLEAVEVMARTGRQQLPLVTAEGEVVGMVSAMDVVRWLSRLR